MPVGQPCRYSTGNTGSQALSSGERSGRELERGNNQDRDDYQSQCEDKTTGDKVAINRLISIIGGGIFGG